MEQLNLGGSGLMVSPVALGCMRMCELDAQEAAGVISTAVDAGVNFFDHADIYGGGESERVFAKARAIAGIPREKLVLQSKCGIRKGVYDLSRPYIVQSVEGILSRLQTDYLDVLLLHRPDALAEPEEVAAAFDELYQSGRVRQFGVSNHSPAQVELLKKAVCRPLVANQLQFSPAHTGMVDCGMDVNMKTPQAVQRDGMVLDYCRLHDMTVQAWSPFQYGQIEGVFFDNPDFADLTKVIRQMAGEKNVCDSAVVTNWILRHPAKMQVVVGTMNPDRLQSICAAAAIPLTREEWYAVYLAAGNPLP